MLGCLNWAFKSIWWNHQMCLPASALGGECLLRGLGAYSSRGLHTAGIQYKFICIKHSDKEKCGGTCILSTYTMHLGCLRTEDVCLRALRCQSFMWVQFIILRKESGKMRRVVYCKVVPEFEKFGWIVRFSHDLMLSVTRCLTSHRDSCVECSSLPENLNFC